VDDSRLTRSPVGSDADDVEPPADPTEVRPSEPEGLESGAHVGRYVVLYRLGRGGMGIVYAAYDPQLDRKVAIKVLRKRRRGRDVQDGQERMLREAQLLAKLSHPNVVAIHDVGIIGEQLFVAMEYIEGQTLRRWLQATERAPKAIVEAFAQAADGLAAAHRAGIVHQDFKPDNAIIDPSGRVHVLDFGLARVRGNSDKQAVVVRRVEGGVEPVSDPYTPSKTKVGMLGTPGYMSPEQHLGEPAGPASDQFSLCVALYEACHGRLPFAGSDHAELALNVTSGRIREPPRHAKPIPAPLRRLIWKGLSVEPAERFPSMEALAAELRRAPAPGRLAWIAGGVLLVGTGAWWSTQDRQAGPCSDGSRALGEAWDTRRRDAVTQVFEASRRRHASRTLTSITSKLDDWSNAWVTAWTDACEATHVRHEQSDELLDLRMTCLRRGLDELDALTSLLAEADDEVVDRASMAVDALPDLRPCADAVALRERFPLPDDAAAQARIGDLQTLLAQVGALWHAGKNDSARRAAKRLLERARELNHPPLLAEALFQQGEILEGAAEPEAASRTLREAAGHAEIARDDRLLANIRVLLILVDGDRLGKSEQGRLWADLARATLIRLGGDPEIESTLENNLAFVVELDAPPQVVLEHRKRALELFDGSPNPRELHRATLVANLAGTLADVGRFDEALRHAEEAYAIWERILGPDHRKTAIGLSTIGLVHDFAGNRQEALTWYERALEGLERALGPDNLHATDVLNNLAIAAYQLGDEGRGEAAFRKVLAIREKALGHDHPDVASAHGNLASSLARRSPEEALHHHRVALDIRKRVFGPNHVAVAGSLAGIANVLEAMEQHEEALALRLEAIEIEQALHGQTSVGLVLPLANLAHNRLLLGQREKAQADAQRALDLATMHQIKDDIRAFARIVLAKVLAVRDRDPDRVRTLVEEALTELGDLPAPDERRLLGDIDRLQKTATRSSSAKSRSLR
jgi:eukaryotic-like serine/threonine-protein kinase